MQKKIVVVDNGFVFVGDIVTDKTHCLILNCRNIRVWGTTKGLGELVSGPLKATVVDACGEVAVPLGRVVFYLTVKGGW